MNIQNATIITTLHHLLTDLKLRHIGGDVFIEACMPPILSKHQPLGPTFLIFDLERSFAISIQEMLNPATGRLDGLMFTPLIMREQPVSGPDARLNPYMRMGHGEVKEMSLLTAYWFLRARSAMSKAQVRQFLKTTYGELSVVQWGNMIEPMDDMDRFLRNQKVPVAA